MRISPIIIRPEMTMMVPARIFNSYRYERNRRPIAVMLAPKIRKTIENPTTKQALSPNARQRAARAPLCHALGCADPPAIYERQPGTSDNTQDDKKDAIPAINAVNKPKRVNSIIEYTSKTHRIQYSRQSF